MWPMQICDQLFGHCISAVTLFVGVCTYVCLIVCECVYLRARALVSVPLDVSRTVFSARACLLSFSVGLL